MSNRLQAEGKFLVVMSDMEDPDDYLMIRTAFRLSRMCDTDDAYIHALAHFASKCPDHVTEMFRLKAIMSARHDSTNIDDFRFSIDVSGYHTIGIEPGDSRLYVEPADVESVNKNYLHQLNSMVACCREVCPQAHFSGFAVITGESYEDTRWVIADKHGIGVYQADLMLGDFIEGDELPLNLRYGINADIPKFWELNTM